MLGFTARPCNLNCCYDGCVPSNQTSQKIILSVLDLGCSVREYEDTLEKKVMLDDWTNFCNTGVAAVGAFLYCSVMFVLSNDV